MSETNSERVAPTSYPYAWTPKSELSIDDFVKKYRPSMVQDDGTKPWIWVRTLKDEGLSLHDSSEAIEEASTLTDMYFLLQNDASIPLRSSKKTGAKSKKELREAAQAEATEKLREISTRHGYVCGKWLAFAPADKVDLIWSNLAKSIVSGPLSSTAIYTAKVSTSPKVDSPNYQHVICMYMPDVYNKTAVTEAMKVLLQDHGMNLSGVKSDLYTCIGLDSKHPSEVQSTIWKNKDLIPEVEIKALKDTFYANLKDKDSKTTAANVQSTADNGSKPAANKSDTNGKRKLPGKKKTANDDPFESDNEDDKGRRNLDDKLAAYKGRAPSAEAIKKRPVPEKKLPRKKAKVENIFADDDDA
ncbi:hypothetical protein PUNSTDRAFT_72870 [Punctularia strigosozonata HHB-11173 SS5]|uniref:uncharacterized protein n=1 Tax=Punctularia strigosozonata (strain HHB-11173) TaxID=741275 RepID=UPI0004418368|nr:uncharacterized protein PUNSTDRAFT_72870 [Punctularia strigosozonata HHB-11173 SS5]EIN06740.1 hypothetical protein PUNSTDRAFT_72870 [Punctularia strigosozonata HHB-11173 SS5]